MIMTQHITVVTLVRGDLLSLKWIYDWRLQCHSDAQGNNDKRLLLLKSAARVFANHLVHFVNDMWGLGPVISDLGKKTTADSKWCQMEHIIQMFHKCIIRLHRFTWQTLSQKPGWVLRSALRNHNMLSGIEVIWGLLLHFVANNNKLEEPHSLQEYEQRRLQLPAKKKKPGNIDIISVFYCSIGHCSASICRLRPASFQHAASLSLPEKDLWNKVKT